MKNEHKHTPSNTKHTLQQIDMTLQQGFNAMTERLDTHTEHFALLNQRISSSDSRFDALMTDTKHRFREVDTQFARTAKSIAELSRSVDRFHNLHQTLDAGIATLHARQERVEHRLDQLQAT